MKRFTNLSLSMKIFTIWVGGGKLAYNICVPVFSISLHSDLYLPLCQYEWDNIPWSTEWPHILLLKENGKYHISWHIRCTFSINKISWQHHSAYNFADIIIRGLYTEDWNQHNLEGLLWVVSVSLFNGISTLFRLFNAKAILLEEQ